MKRETLIYIMLLALIVSGCGAPAAPTIDAASVQSTSAAAAFTVVAQTQAAVPTNTAILATETPTQIPLPTDTLVPSPTLDTLATPTLAAIPTDLSALTATPQAATSGSNPCNHALTSWQGPSASFTIWNETKPQGKILLLMSVVTDQGECGWLNIYSDSFTGPVGNYSASAFVNGPKDFKVFGAFRITEFSWKIVVRNDTITALGGCYPHC